MFADDFKTIRTFAERDNNNIVHWSEFEKGGHYASLEAPGCGDRRHPGVLPDASRVVTVAYLGAMAEPDRADATLEATARIARDLIRFDTTNYGGGRSNGEAEAAEYVGAELRSLGLEPETIEPHPAAHERHGARAGADPEQPALVLHGHLDVVPADRRELERRPVRRRDPRRDAVGPRRRRHEGHGRHDPHRARRHPRAPASSPSATSSSRSSPTRRTAASTARTSSSTNHPELFAGATEAISEVGGYSIAVGDRRAYLLQMGEKALIWIRLVARGTRGARLARASPTTPITKLAEAVAALGRTEWPVRLTDDHRARCSRELARCSTRRRRRRPGRARRSRPGRQPDSSAPRCAPRRTRPGSTAGYKHNVIPDRAEALIDMRTLPGEEDAVLAEIRELVGDDIEIEIVVHRDIGLESAVRGRARRRDGRARSAAHDPGVPVIPYLLGGGTDNKALAELGIAGYGFAPLQLPADLDFPACSTASTSACRSTRSSSAARAHRPAAAATDRRRAATSTSRTKGAHGFIEAIILGLVQGLTEFLPISSSAHLRILGEFLPSAQDPGAAFTAITQIGTETAVVIYFWRDIVRIISHVVPLVRRRGGAIPRQRPRRADGLAHHRRHDPDRACSASSSRTTIRDDVPHRCGSSRSCSSSSACCSGSPTRSAQDAPELTDLTYRTASYRLRADARADPRRLALGRARSRAGSSLGYTRPRPRGTRSCSRSPRCSAAGSTSWSRASSEPDGRRTATLETAVATVVAFVVGLGVIAFLMSYISKHSFLPFVIYRLLLGGADRAAELGVLQPYACERMP